MGRLKEGMKFPGEPGGEPTDPYEQVDAEALHPDFETLSQEVEADHEKKELDSHEALARRLAVAIRSVATDLKTCNTRKYDFEEWAEITRLIRFTTFGREEAVEKMGVRDKELVTSADEKVNEGLEKERRAGGY